MIRYILLISTLALIFSCKPKQELILIETDFGNMKVSLYDSTPQHRDNIKKLAGEGYYDGSLFHRVMSQFMIQGGDPDSKGAAAGVRLGSGGPGYTVPAEIGAYHFKGTLAAARKGPGNPQKESSGSQFYIVHGKAVTDEQLTQLEGRSGVKYSAEDRARYIKNGGTPFLDNDYTVFGEVVEGMDVIDKIAAVKTQPGDRPVEDVKMKVKIIKE